MNKQALKIKNIIDYLIQVSNNETIKDKKQNFFLSIPHLDKILREYFIYFDNKDLSNKSLYYNYNLIKDLSFSKEGKSFLIVKDLSVTNAVHYTKEEHISYSNYIHSHLINFFEDKLEIKKVNEKRRITIKNKKVDSLVEQLNLELDFLRDDLTSKDFVNVLIGTSDKNIHLNIDNRSFYYLLTKLSEYFFNLSITAVAITNKIYSSRGTLISVENLLNSKALHSKHEDAIDRVFKKFE
jgi:hypothetical protein